VQEYGAAPAGDPWPGIVVDFDDQVVERVVATEPVAWFSGRPAEGPIVTAVMRVFAPSVGWTDPAPGKPGLQVRQPIGTPPQPDRMKPAVRGAAIAFALIGLDAAPAERDRDDQGSGKKPALRLPAGPGANADGAQ
jgi:hypothetical protein